MPFHRRFRRRRGRARKRFFRRFRRRSRPLDPEQKNMDRFIGVFPAELAPVIFPITGIVNGADSGQRIGSVIRNTKYHFSYNCTLGTFGLQSATVRVLIVQQFSPIGVALTITQLFSNGFDLITSGYNLNFTRTFRVLYDQQRTMVAGSETGRVLFKGGGRLGFDTVFNMFGASFAGVQTNALLFIALSDYTGVVGQGPVGGFFSRIRFTDY